MGRPKGDAARSKSRPSSSSLAASLLPSGATTVGFGGYVGNSRLDSSVTGQDAAPFMDIDSEMAQHLKRLARKDPTTKLKALGSLSLLLKQRSAKDILPIIPQWAFEYRKLLLDYNREVRRATHDTMTSLVSAVGRELAPHLKSLMGPWWFSQFDAVYEVSQAAKRSFQAAFSTHEKRLDALILCMAEVFLYLEENLRLTPETMCDKAVALDEREEMHQQVISSSLLALGTLLDIMVSLHLDKPDLEASTPESKRASKARSTAISYAEKLFSSHRCFLEFLKSQNSAIRSATYSVLRSCIKNIPNAFDEVQMKTLAPAILGAFQEKDPACHPSMWEAMLLFSKRFPDSWSTLSVQKIVLNRLWHFLRNGCFGSQQVSYPALLLFLDSVPPNLIKRDEFFLEFFRNMWAGRNPSHSLTADRVAFFQAFTESFLWVIQNAGRYCDGVEAMHFFRRILVDNILLELLWHDYLLLPISQNQNRVISGQSQNPSDGSIRPSQKKVEKVDTSYPLAYVQDLGKCIIKVLSGVHSLEPSLLLVFGAEFENNCLNLFQQAEKFEKSLDVGQISRFVMLLEQHAMKQGETWPLRYVVGPTLPKSFQLIQTLDSPDPVRFLVAAVSAFGPRKIVQEIVYNESQSNKHELEDRNEDLSLELFLQVFEGTFIPLCLQENSSSTSARLDLLLILLDNECFSEQWNSIILHATGPEHLEGNSDRTLVLALLMEKTREEIRKRKANVDLYHGQGSHPDDWRHKHLDSTASLVARSSPPFGTSDARFICAVLGGSGEEDQTSLVNRNTAILIFQEILKKLCLFMMSSNHIWVRDACALLSADGNDLISRSLSAGSVNKMANFALEILDGSFNCLTTYVDSIGLPGILAAIFVIDWEYSMSTALDDGVVDKSTSEFENRLELCHSIHDFRSKIYKKSVASLDLTGRERLESILIQSIRCALYKEDNLDTDTITSLCCVWVIESLECLCCDQVEEQKLLDQLLRKDDFWPLWVMPDISSGKRSATIEFTTVTTNVIRDAKVASLIDKLISKLGIDRVVAGYVPCPPSPSKEPEDTMLSQYCFPRAWLAAEILCTWKWQGGSALTSFLPSLVGHTKSQNYLSEDSLLDSIAKVLLDGALLQGVSSEISFSNLSPTSYEELESIEEPYVRALVSLLHTLYENNIWGKDKAVELFNLLRNQLFVGEAVNSNCLRILPLVMSVLIRPMSSRSDTSENDNSDSSMGNHMIDSIEDWFRRTLSFPPLSTWQTGEDMEDWFQLVISCYPLITMGGNQGFEPEREISSVERNLLLDLFQKQREGARAPATVNKLPIVQMLSSKLMVVFVCYCWREFGEDDWEFILYRLRWWIESAVVMMEEVAESVNDAVTDSSTSKNFNLAVKKLENTIMALDSSRIKLARYALVAFTQFCKLIGSEDVENASTLNPLRTERWDLTRERILEGILRLFFTTGAAEAIAGSCSNAASSIVASSRLDHSHFWELIASEVIESSSLAREKAMKSVEIWGLSKGPISSLYAILFSPKPVPCMQYAAYVMLSSEPVSHMAFITEDILSSLGSNNTSDQDTFVPDMSLDNSLHLREEISCLLEKKSLNEVLEMDLLAPQRVHVFLAWSLLISYLQSLTLSSTIRERIVQHVQDSSNSVILDSLFQHIPLELCMVNLKKKEAGLPPSISAVATAATQAIMGSSVLSAVESLWPVGQESMSSFAGAIYGLMLKILPAYVRGWFSDIRDRSTSSAIESFTRSWCSPSLIRNELSQIKKASFSDENFSVSVSKSTNEVVATYTKDETGMDLVIRLPASYPLRPVDVDCTRSLGVSEVKQRKWLLSMMSFVRNQNGALAEAIQTWKNNFDKEFDGVEECPICYSVIHTSNRSLPRLACKTCKHKFHAACMYKWFSTSHKSNCPLCQSPF